MMTLGPVGQTITSKLREAFAPVHLDVVDESHLHAGHSGARPDGESHFRVHIVAEAFRARSRVEQHRMVNAALADELRDRVHALAIKSSAPPDLTFIDLDPSDDRLVALLASSKLPTDDLAGKTFVGIVDAGGTLLASGGLERCGDAVLIRSVAVTPDRRSAKLGSTMTLKLLAEARNGGAVAAYLLTASAIGFFERLGFRGIERGAVPAEVLETSQFTGTACTSAQAMVQALQPL